MTEDDTGDGTRWEQVEALLDEALEKPAGERSDWLHSAVTDPVLRRRVEEMLEAHEKAQGEGFLDTTAVAIPAGTAPVTVGPYRIVEELGRGGMGVVYLAERSDGQFEQKVALKIVKRGFDTDQIIQRFLQERQILARLQHPHIARLLDGGVTDSGQPYFVMEHIDGVPLTNYCDERRLDIESRLTLFEQVGEAVQYAHRNLVVHRDLKPSNILVTPDGRVKLLDFGIAKLIDDEADPGLTKTGMRVLTPAYAAPEQAAGEPVTTAADVYSLGVVLYELLAGHSPQSGNTETTTRIKRPSTAVTNSMARTNPDGSTTTLTPVNISSARATQPDRLRRRLSGDLDTICLKALRSEPDERYDSAAAFVDDLKRHLAGLPVDARSGAAGYRLRKFMQRNRVLVGAGFLVVLSLAIGLAAALWQAQRAREAALRARAEAATAEQVKDYLVTVFGASNPWEEPGGTELTARELLQRGVDRVESLEDEPAVQAELLDALGNVYASLGMYDEAQSLLEDALETRRKLRGPEHAEVAKSMASLAGLMLDMGSYDEAERIYRDVLAMRRRILDPNDIDLGASLNDLAVLLNTKDAYEESEPLLRESLAIQRRVYDGPHKSIAITLANLAGVLRDRSEYEEAEKLYREVLAMQRQLLGNESANVATTMNMLALTLRDQDKFEEAESLMRQSVAMRERIFGEAHDMTAGAKHQLGKLLLDTGRPEEAEQFLREAVAGSEIVNGSKHWKTTLARIALAKALTALESYEDAEQLLLSATEFYHSKEWAGPPFVYSRALEALIELYTAWGKPDQAAEYEAELHSLD